MDVARGVYKSTQPVVLMGWVPCGGGGKRGFSTLPHLSVTMTDIFSIPMMISGLAILTTTVLPATHPFHVVVFSFLVFTLYMHLEILMQWQTIYFNCFRFQDGGGIFEKNVICFLILRFPDIPKNVPVFWKLFLQHLKTEIIAHQDDGLEAGWTIGFE